MDILSIISFSESRELSEEERRKEIAEELRIKYEKDLQTVQSICDEMIEEKEQKITELQTEVQQLKDSLSLLEGERKRKRDHPSVGRLVFENQIDTFRRKSMTNSGEEVILID